MKKPRGSTVSRSKTSAARVSDHASRRISQLAEENRQLRQYVAEVMDRLRKNDRLFLRLSEIETAVLAAPDPEALCFALLRGLRNGFDLDMVRFWFDRASFIGGRKMEEISGRELVWIELDEIRKQGLHRQHVWLMRLSEKKSFAWLEPRDHHLGSIALLVLGDLARPFGVLGMGSVDSGRFGPGQSADFLQHLGQVVSLSLENAVSRERLARLSVTDSLTNSRNLRFLQPYSHQPLSKWFGRDVGVSCLFLDVDGFQAISARLGDEAGDEVLNTIAGTVRKLVRMQDPLIRMGGDEFVLLLPGCPSWKAKCIANDAIRVCGEIAAGETDVSISAGLAYTLPEQDMRVKFLIAAAEQAMYVAKALGGGRLEISGEAV